jgi:hypothetical protein
MHKGLKAFHSLFLYNIEICALAKIDISQKMKRKMKSYILSHQMTNSDEG